MPTKAQSEQRAKALEPYQYKKGERSREEAARNGKLGGIASGEARKEKKLFKDEIAKRLGAKDFEEIIDNLIERSKHNDGSFETLRDTVGQKPAQEVNLTSDLDEFEFNFKYTK